MFTLCTSSALISECDKQGIKLFVESAINILNLPIFYLRVAILCWMFGKLVLVSVNR